MKKLLLNIVCLVALFAAGMSLKAQEITITLSPGWNWISYPNAVAMEINEALATFTPMEGDMVKGPFSFATYYQGQWTGGLTHFTPGVGYMYCSLRTETISFVFAQASSSVVETATPTDITATSAVTGGMLTLPEGSHVFMRGVCWGTEPSPDIDGCYTTDGMGIGSFGSTLEDLAPNTTYYVRAYAVSDYGLAYGNEVSFTTQVAMTLPTVTTSQVTNIAQITAKGGGNVTNDGGETVTARGVCWSTSHNPTVSGSHASSGTGTGTFRVNMTGLTAGTTYYVRAYAVNSQGTAYGSEVSFTTQVEVTLPTVTTSQVTNITRTTATGGGNVTNSGNATVSERGLCWSTSHNPTVSGSHASSSTGTGAFTLNMTGLTAGTTYYVRAYAVNSQGTSYGSEVSFTTLIGGGNAPQGAIFGLFTINANGDQVYFSQGNLQYKASTNTWQFAEHQYDYVGNANQNISQTNSGWIDLFGWGTSGYNHGSVCYQPWSTSHTNGDYYAYGGYTNNLYEFNGQADWGYNAIANGGNTEGQWRTLTSGEWGFVFYSRNTASGIRYAKAQVNNVNGVVLLPDDWNASIYTLNSTNTYNANFTTNTITAADWADTLEANGAVFLPAAGYRSWTSVYGVGSRGDYWSASAHIDSAFNVYFNSGTLSTVSYDGRYYGRSVRLVRLAE